MDKQFTDRIRTIIREELGTSTNHISREDSEELFRKRIIEDLTDQVLKKTKRIFFLFGTIGLFVVSSFFVIQVKNVLKETTLAYSLSEARYNVAQRRLSEAFERMDQLTALLAEYKAAPNKEKPVK